MKHAPAWSSLGLWLVIACGAQPEARDGAPPFSGAAPEPTTSDQPAVVPVEGGSGGTGGSEPPRIDESQDPDLPVDVGGSPPGDDGGAAENLPGGTTEPEPPPPGTLREAADGSGRLIGVALATNRLFNNEAYAGAAQEFNYVTHENEMKWNAVEPQPGQFNFSNADRTIAFAEENGMRIKGHTLVWHSQLPGWARQLDTRDAALEALERHITTVVSRYRGRVVAWDVVNEAFTDGGNPRLRGSDPADASDPNNDNGNNGLDSVFRRLIGEDYIDRAFRAANAADPDALLIYNDYNTEGMNAKSNAVYEMVQGMLERGVPIHAVGLQMHINAAADNLRSAEDVAANIRRLTALGLQVQISELDVSLCGGQPIEQRRELQRARLEGIVGACTAEPLCTAITVWGVGDDDSWRDAECNGGRSEPLLFDATYQRKLAYEGVFDALLAAPAAAVP
ncbi:MAG TPA: endo-1,4-beta-xylanase [Polyangiaceae bacterium]|nr:endo-1,4-beta-xylanase [Polyangiaceae bacterium]